MNLRLHHILEDTAAEGPGRRFCIWVQGCLRRCPGCFAEDTWDPAGGYASDTETVVGQLRRRMERKPPLEGVTFLGGEPFLQAAALSEIAAFARENGLGVFCFTGFTLEELRAEGDGDRLALLEQIDLLADGAYIAAERDFSRPWLGSKNQRFHFLTDRYTPGQIAQEHNRVEVRIRPDGTMTINGMADFPAMLAGSLPDTESKRGKQA